MVDLLEERYPDFPGLNLSWEVREGIIKHSSAFDKSVKIKDLAPKEMPTLETQVVDIADEIAYDNHDLDDGITSGLIKEANLEKLPIWNNISKETYRKYAKILSERRKYLIIRSLINMQVTDLIQETEKRITKLKLKSCAQAKRLDNKIVSFSTQVQNLRRPLRTFLMENLYHHYRVIRMSNKAKRFIQELFKIYITNSKQLPPHIQKNISADGVRRVICDYIAGMTDRYALDEYKKLFDPYEKV